MKKAFLFFFLWSVCGAVLAAADGEKVHYLTFTARDQNGIYLRDLKLEEVELRVDGEAVDVKYLGYRNVPTAFAFFLENSPRTAQYGISQPQWGRINTIDRVRYEMLFGFFRPLTEMGPVLLAEFHTEVHILQDFTEDDYRLEEALHRISPNFTKIGLERADVGRALGRGVDLLRARPERRKFLVLFTATVDRESYQNLEEYREMFKLSGIELFVVSFASRFPTGPGHSFEEQMNGYYFRHLAQETSGKAYITGEYAYLDTLFTDLKARLTHSYTIGFHLPADPARRERKVSLKVRNDKCEVTYRNVLVD